MTDYEEHDREFIVSCYHQQARACLSRLNMVSDCLECLPPLHSLVAQDNPCLQLLEASSCFTTVFRQDASPTRAAILHPAQRLR